MIFSKKFMTDMNELLGPQGWGQYFCEPSLAWFDQVHGDAELPYWNGLQSIRTHPDIPEDERAFWVKTVKLLQSNIQAIKYNDRYVIDGYKIIGPQYIDLDFEDYESAVITYRDLIKSFYTVDNYFKCAKISETNEGVTINQLLNFDDVLPNDMITVYSGLGKTVSIEASKLNDYIAEQIEFENQTNTLQYTLYKKIKDIDGGFIVLEQIKV